MRLLDLFAGRLGWSKAFLARGWEVVAVDLTMPSIEIPPGVEYLLMDVLTITPEWIKSRGFDFICASSLCEQFSVHGMKHFHPNPPYPELGIKLFNHTRYLCEASGLPYVMENVRAAQKFVGRAEHHCGPFYLWGNGIPLLLPQGIKKGVSMGHGSNIKHMKPEEKYAYRKQFACLQVGGKSAARAKYTASWATIPPELSTAVADYAERLIEMERTA